MSTTAFDEIDEARKVLGLLDSASMREIKQAYRRLSFQFHPDQSNQDVKNDEAMKKINWAYKVLLDYCARYKYLFREEDIARAYPEEWNMKRYMEGWFY